MSVHHTDFFGREIKVGQLFTMAYRNGNSAEAGVGIVREVNSKHVRARVAKVSWSQPVKVNSKDSLLGATDRLVIVPVGTFPGHIQAELEQAQ